MVRYVRTHALMYEYHRQALEIIPPHIGKVLHELFKSEAFQIVNTRLAIYMYGIGTKVMSLFLSGNHLLFYFSHLKIAFV